MKQHILPMRVSRTFEIFENFTYLCNVVQNNGEVRQKVLRRIGLARGVMDLLITSMW